MTIPVLFPVERDAPKRPQAVPAAFSLVELLCALGVGLILVGLCVPAMSKMLDGGRNAKSMSNMRQIGIMAVAFAGDNNGSLPCGWDEANKRSWFQQLTAAGLITPNTQRSLMVCPLMDRQYGRENSDNMTSYAMNNNLGDRDSNLTGLKRIQQGSKPSSTALLFNSIYYPGTHNWRSAATASSEYNTVIPAYKNLVNVLFLDNSIRTMDAADPRLLGKNGGKGSETKLFWQGRNE